MQFDKNNTIKVNSSNIKQVMKYISAAKELNRFAKDTFNKEQKSYISFAEALPDLHKEIEYLEKECRRYIEASPKEFVTSGKCYRGKLNNAIYASEMILKVKSVSQKEVTFDAYVVGSFYKPENFRAEYINGNSAVKEFVWSIIDKNLIEIDESVFEDVKDKYNNVRELLS